MTANKYRNIANRTVATVLAATTAFSALPTQVRAETTLPGTNGVRATTENSCLIAKQEVTKNCTTPPAPRRAPPPRPVAPIPVPVAAPPAEPQPVITYQPSEPIVMPGGTISGDGISEKDKKFVDSSDCNYQGFWNAVAHPINAQCVRNSVSQTTTMGLTLQRVNGQNSFVQQGLIIVSATRASEGVAGQGWFIPVVQGIGTFASIGIGIEGLNIASQSLKATQNLDASIGQGIKDGKITNIFGSGTLDCGSVYNSASTTKSNAGTCVINSLVSGSGIGQGNQTSSTGNYTRLNGAYGLNGGPGG